MGWIGFGIFISGINSFSKYVLTSGGQEGQQEMSCHGGLCGAKYWMVGSDHMSFGAHGQPVSGGQLQPGAALYTRRNAELVV